MTGTESPPGFYRPRASGGVVCALCAASDHAHAPDCPVMVLHAQLRELAGQLGLFVATTRETLDALERLLRGEIGNGTQ
jgi:hypothetical protein